MLLPAPVITVVKGPENPNYPELNSVEFTFVDNPDWRTKITSIKMNNAELFNSLNKTTPGVLNIDNLFINFSFQWDWVIKATGYQDVVLGVN